MSRLLFTKKFAKLKNSDNSRYTCFKVYTASWYILSHGKFWLSNFNFSDYIVEEKIAKSDIKIRDKEALSVIVTFLETDKNGSLLPKQSAVVSAHSAGSAPQSEVLLPK